MSDRLTLVDEKIRWYPASVASLEDHLAHLNCGDVFFDGNKTYASRKNIAYSLQHLEFLNRVIEDVSLSSILWSQNVIGGKKYKNLIEVLEKLENPIRIQMTFDQLAKKVESKKLLGNEFRAYSKINPIRKLRNKIHIHSPDHEYNTDWTDFNKPELRLIRTVLYSVLTSEVFINNDTFMHFEYLNEK
jgi:hypothetical protein